MPNHQHSSQRRQSPQKHEPDGTRSQNHQAGVDAHQPCRQIRFSLPADLRFYNKLPSAVCGHGAASNALFGKMFRARGSAAPSSNRAQSQRQMFFALHHCQLFRRRFQKTENENRGRVWIGQQTRRISESTIRGHTRRVGSSPPCKRRRTPGTRGWRRALPKRIESQSLPNKKPGARPGFGLQR